MADDRPSTLPKSSDPAELAGERFCLARQLSTPVWIYDFDHCRILCANAAALTVWQAKTEAELVARDLGADMTPAVALRLKQYKRDFEESQSIFKEIWTLYPNGVPKSANVKYSGYTLEDGRTAMLCEVLEGMESEDHDTLRSAEALLRTDVMISLYSIDGPPLYLNPAARSAVRTSGQIFRMNFASPDEYTTFMFELDRVGEHRAVVKVLTSEGVKWHDMSVRTCADAATGAPSLLVTEIDVSELKNARDKARFLADRDILTGSFNRSYLQQHMAKLAERTNANCAAVYFDIDHFKQLNDQYGHELGDVVLKEIADRARGAVRDWDLVVRLGGDEFVVLMENVELDADHAPQLDRLKSVLCAPVFYNAHRIEVSVSLGVALFRPSSSDFASVLREADTALYKSKTDGRNRWTIYTRALGLEAEKQRSIETELESAIKNNEFVLHFQPRVCLASEKIVSVEALVRWNHPERGLIYPDQFIPTCEATGMILDLGQLVLEAGCEQAMAAQEQELDVNISINISPRQFEDPRLMQTLENFAEQPEFPTDRVELEITENVLIGDLSKIEKKLKQISKLGYQIAVDDFGTGYSNLSYISRFPLNCLKIDRSFIQQLPQSGPVISLILTLAQQIGARTVAEGVETQEDVDFLVAQRCDEAQGHFFSKALPLAELKELLHANSAAEDVVAARVI